MTRANEDKRLIYELSTSKDTNAESNLVQFGERLNLVKLFYFLRTLHTTHLRYA